LRTVRLLSTQIPDYWELIKWVVAQVQAGRLSDQERALYFNRLLHALLNDKAHCFVRVNDDRKIVGFVITRITLDQITGEKTMMLECGYSFQKVSDITWQEGLALIKQYAEVAECKKVTLFTANERVMEIAKIVGLKEKLRCFSARIEDL